ncbi:hypothetical protein DL93DRAFT_1099356 [Clavulina sp. PMI_390]|nr:hypothetical protein DL93DRAFT_1099356 [Clavulina sp. PMI_390]
MPCLVYKTRRVFETIYVALSTNSYETHETHKTHETHETHGTHKLYGLMRHVGLMRSCAPLKAHGTYKFTKTYLIGPIGYAYKAYGIYIIRLWEP